MATMLSIKRLKFSFTKLTKLVNTNACMYREQNHCNIN